MDSLKHLVLVPILMLILPLSSFTGTFRDGEDYREVFFAQSAERLLNREFTGGDLSFLLFDALTGEVLVSRWTNPDLPIPMGSLLKPFVALAYGQQHGFGYPKHHCGGLVTGCWNPHGHGDIDLTSAIAYSCNSYFRLLTTNLTASETFDIARRFDLDPPPEAAAGMVLAGIGSTWRVAPVRMGRAYIELSRLGHEPDVSQILNGMAQSARQGTGAEVDRALQTAEALVKTGTAPCTHTDHAPGDGFTVALFPANDPKLLLLVRVHGIPGAESAKTAGRMLHRIGE